jgi:hypothetical protein
MTDIVQIKAIIKQYADKGERLLEEAYENGEHASTTGYWDGYGDCANLLLRELDDMQEEPTVSVWHDASKKPKPKEGSWICVSFSSRDLSTFLYEDGKIHNNYVDIEMTNCKWAYQEDLLKL